MTDNPTPIQRHDVLKNAFKGFTEVEVLREALGLRSEPSARIPAIGRPLVPHIKVVCIDTESWTDNTDHMTELGLVQTTYTQVKQAGEPSEHGFRVLQQLTFMHFRIVENAHLKIVRKDSRGPEGNRYGKTRWTTFAELRNILKNLLMKPIGDIGNGRLQGCMIPIVLVGHALSHDIGNTSKPPLSFDLASIPSIVALVDTQLLARKVGIWDPKGPNKNDQISLRDLTDKLGFDHRNSDPHTACNDAARTMISAIHMVLKEKERRPPKQTQTLQEVVKQLELSSQNRSLPFGTAKCCPRCGGRTHSEEDCTESLLCNACHRFDPKTDEASHAHSHSDSYCVHIAAWKAWVRRFKSANERHNGDREAMKDDVKDVPTANAHPWSNYPRILSWPYEDLFEAVADFDASNRDDQYREPAPEVVSLEAALGPFPVPSRDTWRMKDGSLKVQAVTGTTTSTVSTTSVTQALAATTLAPPLASNTVMHGRGAGQGLSHSQGPLSTERGRAARRGRSTGRDTARGTARGTAPGSGSAGDSQSQQNPYSWLE